MSDAPVARWLDTRRPPMPAALRSAVDAALRRSSESSSAGALAPAAGARAAATVPPGQPLAAAGLSTLAGVAGADAARTGRGRALELLAADALLTYACEAAAEEGPEALDDLLGRLRYDRFGALLEPRSQ